MRWSTLLLPLALSCNHPKEESGPSTKESVPDPETGPSLASVEHVVILVMDGARSDETIFDGISSASGDLGSKILPHMRSTLFPQGTLLRPAYSTGVTNTSEGHMQMLAGVRLPQCNFPSELGTGWFLPEAPTIYEQIRSQQGVSSDQVWLVANTPHLQPHIVSTWPGLGADYTGTYEAWPTAQDDDDVIDAVLEKLANHDVRFILGNLHRIDYSGHYARQPSDYTNAISSMDDRVIEVWDWIQSHEPYADRTLFVVTADHGRHRYADNNRDWRDHGDQCAGCRQVFLFLAGPGIKEDNVVAGRVWMLEDLHRTAAWLLGVESPLSTGLVIEDALEAPPTSLGTPGDVWPWASGGHLAWQRFTGQPGALSQVIVDDEVLSTPDATQAEAPRLASSPTTLFACWREILVTPTVDQVYLNWSWVPRCSARVGALPWRDLAFPEPMVWPFFEPALQVDQEERLWLAYVWNPEGTGDTDNPVQVRIARYAPDTGWEGNDRIKAALDVAYPIYPTMAVSGETAWVAYTTSDHDTEDEEKKYARYERHLEVRRVDWPTGGDPTWTRLLVTEVLDEGHGTAGALYARMEHPQLILQADGILRLAAVAYGDTVGNTLIQYSSADGGATWTGPDRLDTSGQVVGYVPPRWSDSDEPGWLTWLRKAGDTVEVCRKHVDADPISCVDTGFAWVQGLAPVAGGARVSGLADGEWGIREIEM